MTTAAKLQRVLDTKADLRAEIDDFLSEANRLPMPENTPFFDYAAWLDYARGGELPPTNP